MQSTDDFEDCIRCGVKIHRGIEVSVQAVMALSNVAPEAYAQKISDLEGLGLAVAQEYVDHRMGNHCTRRWHRLVQVVIARWVPGMRVVS